WICRTVHRGRDPTHAGGGAPWPCRSCRVRGGRSEALPPDPASDHQPPGGGERGPRHVPCCHVRRPPAQRGRSHRLVGGWWLVPPHLPTCGGNLVDPHRGHHPGVARRRRLKLTSTLYRPHACTRLCGDMVGITCSTFRSARAS